MFKRIGKAANIGKEIGKTAMSKDGREKMKAQLKKTGKRVAGNLGVLKKAACNSAQTKKNLESIKHLQEMLFETLSSKKSRLLKKCSLAGSTIFH